MKDIPIFLPEDTQLPPEPPKTQKSPWRINLQKLLRRKFLLIGIISASLLGMGTYIFISPAEQKEEITRILTPVIIPDATQIPPTPPLMPVIEIPTPTPQPTAMLTPSATPMPTIPPGTAWITYINKTQGYRIKYSPDWVVKDVGVLEPKIPSYIAFNQRTASDSSRFITIGITTRTYQEQLALGASSSAITIAGIKGTKQTFQDSDGHTSTVIVLPRSNDLIVLRAKTAYLPLFNLMLSTLSVTN
jgi:hypothetical protein